MAGLITTDEFTYYSSYFTMAAQSGILSSQALTRAAETAKLLDATTIDAFSYRDVVNERNSLLVNLQDSYSEILTEALAMEPMRDAFRELSNHIITWYGDTVDNYLEANGLTVSSTYAQISGYVGSPISASHIL